MFISETWLHPDRELEKVADKLQGKGGIGMINRTRKSKGGGISILYKNNEINLTEYRFKRKNHEIVAASGKITWNKRPCLMIRLCHSKKRLSRDRVGHYNYVERKKPRGVHRCGWRLQQTSAYQNHGRAPRRQTYNDSAHKRECHPRHGPIKPRRTNQGSEDHGTPGD